MKDMTSPLLFFAIVQYREREFGVDVLLFNFLTDDEAIEDEARLSVSELNWKFTDSVVLLRW